MLAVAACGSTSSPTPRASGSVQGATATPAASLVTAPIEAIVVWAVDDARPYFDLVVESIAPMGVARPVTTLRDVHPAGWADATPRLDAPILASNRGWLLVSVERNGGGAPDLERTLLLRLDSPQRAPLELPNVTGRAAWGPGGELATLAPQQIVVDPESGVTTEIRVPPRVDLLEAWSADGSGWLAVERVGESGQQVGVVRRNGSFADGVPSLYGLTGRERLTGADGQILNVAVSDGPRRRGDRDRRLRSGCLPALSRVGPVPDTR
jgi:hypothetical protein